MIIILTLLVGSYLVGSLSSAILFCYLTGRPDPRTQGSGNPGATNILRLYGKTAAAITLAGDLLKGLLPILIGKYINMPHIIIAGMGVAAFTGHLFPIFFRFQGGKGVATFIGVLYGFAWQAGIAFMLIWMLTAKLFKYSSLSALVATALSPVVMYLAHPVARVYVVATVVMAALVFWRHKGNIQKLLAGTESKIGAR